MSTILLLPSFMSSNVSASFPQSITVEGFEIHKLRMSEYAQVFDKLQKLPVVLQGMDLEDANTMLLALPKIVATALPEIIEILAVATRKNKEEIDEKMDVKVAVKCMKAFFEVNDFFGVWEEISASLPKKQKPKM